MPASPTFTPSQAPPTASAVAGDRCVHTLGVYAVTYPSDWYSNLGEGDWYIWGPCSLFGPQPFLTADDPSIAIRLFTSPVAVAKDPFAPLTMEREGSTLLRDEATTIAGRDAWVREFQLMSISGSHNAGDRLLQYAVDIGDDWFVSADAVMAPDDYEAVSAVLMSMLEGLEVLEVPAH